jgi:hypothetical protein
MEAASPRRSRSAHVICSDTSKPPSSEKLIFKAVVVAGLSDEGALQGVHDWQQTDA